MTPSRFHRIAAVAVVALAVWGLAGCGGGGGSDVGGPGKEIFEKNCASCHGKEGEGLFGPNLHGVAERYTVDEHVQIVTEGRNNRMPSFQELGPEKIRQVVDYEREAFK